MFLRSLDLPGQTIFPPLNAAFETDLRGARCIVLAGWVALVYDFLLIFPDEVAYIWPMRFSIVKITFIVNRYCTLCFQTLHMIQFFALWTGSGPSDFGFCDRFFWGMTIAILLSYTSINIALCLRVWAIWARRTWVTIVLVCLFVAQQLASGVINIATLVLSARISPAHLELAFVGWPHGICYVTAPPSQWVTWLSSIILECAVLVLSCISLRRSIGPHPISPLVARLSHDGIMYFSVSIVCYVANILILYLIPTAPYSAIPQTMTHCLVSIATQRLVLSLRRIDPSTSTSDEPQQPRTSDSQFELRNMRISASLPRFRAPDANEGLSDGVDEESLEEPVLVHRSASARTSTADSDSHPQSGCPQMC